MTGSEPKKSDLKLRTLSAIVMVVISTFVFWQGGVVLWLFTIVAATWLMIEWWNLVSKLTVIPFARAVWMAAGFIYIGAAAFLLPFISQEFVHGSARCSGFLGSIGALIVFGVIATDIGAYFAGSTIGGPKIAPSISPSKTWSGLCGGVLLAGLSTAAIQYYNIHLGENSYVFEPRVDWLDAITTGAVIAVIAQIGDFLESWMKRRAGVKDSGNLIPGHGGLLDRVDGHLAVLFATALLLAFSDLFSVI